MSPIAQAADRYSWDPCSEAGLLVSFPLGSRRSLHSPQHQTSPAARSVLLPNSPIQIVQSRSSLAFASLLILFLLSAQCSFSLIYAASVPCPALYPLYQNFFFKIFSIFLRKPLLRCLNSLQKRQTLRYT